MNSYEEYSQDLKQLSIKARRFGFANRCLSTEAAQKAHEAFERGAQGFANKYGMDAYTAREMAIHVAETCDMGLAY